MLDYKWYPNSNAITNLHLYWKQSIFIPLPQWFTPFLLMGYISVRCSYFGKFCWILSSLFWNISWKKLGTTAHQAKGKFTQKLALEKKKKLQKLKKLSNFCDSMAFYIREAQAPHHIHPVLKLGSQYHLHAAAFQQPWITQAYWS